ncbi:MAG: TIGR02757 family protein [Bacteroidota bacterium]
MNTSELRTYLNEAAELYNQPSFIENDPISIPHAFQCLQDIEIMGFWTAMLAWGQRVTIINKARELVRLMGHQPYEFILHHKEKDRKAFLDFKHRTFNATDTLYFLEFLQWWYRENESLESAFTHKLAPDAPHVGDALTGFHELFFSLDHAPARTRKHVATPARKSSCKRLNMFLRWMVRRDDKGVDFGLWKNIQPSQLLIPMDVHVDRVARRLGLLTRKQRDFRAVLELTDSLRAFDPDDPVRYDFSLFGIGVLEKNRAAGQ